MTAPRPPGPATRAPTALDVTLGLAGALVLVLGLTQHFAPATASRTFDQDPGMRATGVALALLGWMTLTSARYTATGSRRLLGRLAGTALTLAAAVRLVGLRALLETDALLPARTGHGTRALAAGCVLIALAAWVRFTSPARRWRR